MSERTDRTGVDVLFRWTLQPTESPSGAESKTKPLNGNKMEGARVIGCIRVARKLMPLETVCK